MLPFRFTVSLQCFLLWEVIPAYNGRIYIASVKVLPLTPCQHCLLVITQGQAFSWTQIPRLGGNPLWKCCVCALFVPIVGVKHNNHQQVVNTAVLKPQESAHGGSSYVPLKFNKFAVTVELFRYL